MGTWDDVGTWAVVDTGDEVGEEGGDVEAEYGITPFVPLRCLLNPLECESASEIRPVKC